MNWPQMFEMVGILIVLLTALAAAGARYVRMSFADLIIEMDKRYVRTENCVRETELTRREEELYRAGAADHLRDVNVRVMRQGDSLHITLDKILAAVEEQKK